MFAQIGNFKLVPGDPPAKTFPCWAGGLSHNGEDAYYQFFETDHETYLAMHYRYIFQMVRVVNHRDDSVNDLDDEQKTDLGTTATLRFATHICDTGGSFKEISSD